MHVHVFTFDLLFGKHYMPLQPTNHLSPTLANHLSTTLANHKPTHDHVATLVSVCYVAGLTLLYLLFCMQLTKAFVAETSCISCY